MSHNFLHQTPYGSKLYLFYIFVYLTSDR